MLLTILNLPYNVKYSDIKALVRATCDIEDMIMDSLVMHDEHSKKVTLGLNGEGDAAILMKKLNGFYMDGHQLQVVPKSKNMPPSNPGLPTPQLPLWTKNYGAANAPSMVPAPLSYDMNINQSAFYQLNQPNYPIQPTPSTSNMQLTSYPFGNSNNRQVSWTGKHVEMPNNSQNVNQCLTWNKDEFNLDNNHDSKRDNNRDPNWRSELGWDNNRKPDWGNSRDTKRHNKHDSEWNNNRVSRWDNDDREPGWKNNCDSNWNDDRNSRWNSNRDSMRDKDRDSNRSSYRPNQSAVSLRGRESSYARRDQVYSRSSPRQIYGNHVRSLDKKSDLRDNKPHQKTLRRNRSPQDRWIDRSQSPYAKVSRFEEANLEAALKKIPQQRAQPPPVQQVPDKKQLANAYMWRSQLSGTYAKIIMNSFKYEVPDREKLYEVLKCFLRARIDKFFKNNYTISVKEMQNICNQKFSQQNQWVIMRDSLVQVGGKMLRTGKNKGKKTKKSKAIPVAPQHGAVYGNLKVDHRYEPQGPDQQPATSKPNAAMQPATKPQYSKEGKPFIKKEKVDDTSNFTGEDYAGSIMSQLDPAMKAALNEEMDKLVELIEDECKDPPLDEVDFCKELLVQVPDFMKTMMQINVTRRIRKILPVAVRVVADPPVFRTALVHFLKQHDAYNPARTGAIKKSVLTPNYVIHCETFDIHDKLCAMKDLTIDKSQITFKPLHVAGVREKINPTTIIRNRQMAKKLVKQYKLEKLGLANKQENAPPVKSEVNAEKQLCQEMKELYDSINDGGDKNTEMQKEGSDVKEEKEEIKYVSPITSTANDLTVEANIEQIIENLNEEACLPVIEDKVGDGVQIVDDDKSVEENGNQIETVDLVDDEEVKPAIVADDVDLADVNDDDLEDW